MRFYKQIRNLSEFLAADICAPHQFERLHRDIIVSAPLCETFAFFADAANLQRITPPWLHFSILTAPAQMRVGLEIAYRIRLYGLPLPWRSRIEEWRPGLGFVDRQTHARHESSASSPQDALGTRFSASILIWKPRTSLRPCPTPRGGQRKSKFRCASREAARGHEPVAKLGRTAGASRFEAVHWSTIGAARPRPIPRSARTVARALEAHREDIERGALLSIDEGSTRLRMAASQGFAGSLVAGIPLASADPRSPEACRLK
jgi:hypothetical protein